MGSLQHGVLEPENLREPLLCGDGDSVTYTFRGKLATLEPHVDAGFLSIAWNCNGQFARFESMLRFGSTNWDQIVSCVLTRNIVWVTSRHQGFLTLHQALLLQLQLYGRSRQKIEVQSKEIFLVGSGLSFFLISCCLVSFRVPCFFSISCFVAFLLLCSPVLFVFVVCRLFFLLCFSTCLLMMEKLVRFLWFLWTNTRGWSKDKSKKYPETGNIKSILRPLMSKEMIWS